MTAPTTHWSTTGQLHTGTVAGCEACEVGKVAGIMPVADFRLLEHQVLAGCGFHAFYGEDCAFCGDGEGEKARETAEAAAEGDLRGPAVRADVSGPARPAERRTATQGGYLCRHGLYRHEHWCDDHDDHAREGEK